MGAIAMDRSKSGQPSRHNNHPATRAQISRSVVVIESIESRLLMSAAGAAASMKSGAGTSSGGTSVQSQARVAPAVALPATPVALTATPLSTTQINLVWSTTDSLATSYFVERSTGGGAFTQIATVTSKKYSNTGLAVNTTYTYRVIAHNSAGSSSPTAPVSATTKNKTPSTPIGLTATAISSSQINLAWSTSDSLATSFNIERSLNGTSFTRIATVAIKSYSDTGLTASKTYTYRVSATNAVGTSATSSKVSATTKAPVVLTPAAPINLKATPVSISQINLTWSAGDALATGFIVERSTGSGFTQIATVATTSYNNTGLAEGATYTYRVTAYNASGSSPASATATAATLKRPAAPINLAALPVSISQINLTWSAGDALATSYIVERSSGAGFTQVANVATTGFNDIGLTEGATYSYRVTAYNTAGSSLVSGTKSATTLQRPAAPIELTATPVSISRIDLAWSAGDALATGYLVERSSGAGFTQVADVTSQNYSDIGLVEGATYTYRITAYNLAGSSPASATKSATTLQRPAAPTGLTATPASNSKIDLSWSAGDALATGYIVERSSGAGFSKVADVASQDYSDLGLTEGATYTYRVTAYNTAGSSPASATKSAATLQRPAVPISLSATPASISQIDLAWSTSDALAAGFIVERSSGAGFTQIADVSTQSYSDTGLAEGASYTYRVTAYNDIGSSPASATSSASTLQRPAMPTALTATPASISQINLAWSAGDALATGYIVERSTGAGAFAQIATVATNSYSSIGLAEGTAYTFRVTTYNAGGSSPASGTATTSTLKRPAATSTPVASPVSASQINLTWTAGDALATGYIVERSSGAGFTQVGNVATTSFNNTGLTEGSTYSYRVTAYNLAGSAPVSGTVTATTLKRPIAPINLSGTGINSGQISLKWTAGDALATGFLVERSADGIKFTQVANVTTASYTDGGLSVSTAYVYRVTAYNTVGSSPASLTATASTTPGPISPITLTTAVVSQTEVDLTWAPGDAITDGYLIERSTNFGAFTQIADITDTAFNDTTLSQNTIYTYRVSAYNVDGKSAPATAQVTTLPDPIPDPPAARPDATSTGVDPSVVLTTLAAFKPKSNTAYANLYITGQMTLTGLTNISFTNCIIDAGGTKTYDVRCDGATNIVIDHCELKGATSAAIYGDGYTATANYVHQISGDGFKAGNNVMLYGNYLEDLGYNNLTAHADGVQIVGSSHIRIIGNYFNMPINTGTNESNTNLFLQGAARDVIFAGNWCLGGNFNIHAYADGGGGSTIYLINNTFYTGTVRYGFAQIGSGVHWDGNLTDTGLIALPASK